MKLSKPIIDKIDKVSAKHYGFTEEELDFIINYDIKYRMGDERSPYCPHSIGQRRSANGRGWPWSVGFIHGWREVLKILLRGKCGIFVVLARGMYHQVPQIYEEALQQNRLLLLSYEKDNLTRISERTAHKRNEWVVSLSDEINPAF